MASTKQPLGSFMKCFAQSAGFAVLASSSAYLRGREMGLRSQTTGVVAWHRGPGWHGGLDVNTRAALGIGAGKQSGASSSGLGDLHDGAEYRERAVGRGAVDWAAGRGSIAARTCSLYTAWSDVPAESRPVTMVVVPSRAQQSGPSSSADGRLGDGGRAQLTQSSLKRARAAPQSSRWRERGSSWRRRRRR